MISERQLSYKKLQSMCDTKLFDFNDTSELEPLDGIIGQERAVKAMAFGLKIRIRGYNLYMSGATGTGKTSFAQNYIKKIAAKEKVPDDWCYVYNFSRPNEPMAINLPAGLGKVFKKDMENFVKILKVEITKAFDSEDYEREKSDIVHEFQELRIGLMEKLSEEAEKHGFKVRTTNSGIYFMPIIEGKPINEEEYEELDDKVKRNISENSNRIQMETVDIIRKIRNIEKEAGQKIATWENKIALFAVGVHINDMKEKYRDYTKINNYLEQMQDNILQNLGDFQEEESSDEQQQLAIPWAKHQDSPEDKYRVNLLVDNSSLKGAPVIVDFNPTYYNLMGKLEYENEFGTMTTDYTLIKSGFIHNANGGYLILQAKDVLSNAQSWDALKRVLRTKQIGIGNLKDQTGMVAVSALKPQPIPVDIKVVLVGSEALYQTLYEYDEDFSKLFKVKVDFDDEMEMNEENLKMLARFITSFCNREKTLHFDRTGVGAVADYSSRLVEDQTKLSTRFNDIVEILCESCAWAEIDGDRLVNVTHVKKAMDEKRYRSNKYDQKLLELLQDGTLMIDTEGEVVGQINGLTVLDMGDYTFGKPSRITANTFIGESGIVNVEREIQMSGTSHSKGVLILSGYIGQKYAQEIPLALSASLCFEQLYSGVDGDSASSAELYAILSSLSEMPIQQGFAVTGSVNQKGEIQPIGGATNKIEGFFELCKLRGLTGKQGVIIPYQNIKNLVLRDDVVKAVEEGMFHIYPVRSIDEGIEILTGIPAGVKNSNGKYPAGSINYKVYEKLKEYALRVACFGKNELCKRQGKKAL